MALFSVRHRRVHWCCVVSVALLGVACAVDAQVAPEIGEPWVVSPPGGSDDGALHDDLSSEGPVNLARLSLYALSHHPSTKEAWESALVDAAGVDAARALLWPTVTGSLPVSASRTVGGKDTTVTAPLTGPPNGWTKSASAGISLNWVVFDFGARADSLQAARWQAVSSALAYDRELQSVVTNVEKSYFAEMAALELVRALEVNLAAAQASLDATSARRAAGMATIGDDAQARAAAATARLQLVQARASERADAGALAVAVGVPVGTRLELLPDAQDSAEWQAIVSVGVDGLLAEARLSRADLRALDAQVAQAQAQLAATRAQGLPSLSVGAGASRTWSSGAPPASMQQVALTLNIPIFDGGLVRAQTAAARAKARQVAASRDAQALSVQLDVWQAFQTAQSAQAAIDAAGESLASAVIAEQSARERYRAGMGTFVELLIAQGTVAQARVTEIQARYDARTAYANLGYAVGSVNSLSSHGAR